VWFGTNFIGAANTIYGILLVLCVIFMPQGVVGTLQRMKLRRRSQAKPVTAKNGVTT
jgi:branched-chain amino acid transport system permease protein